MKNETPVDYQVEDGVAVITLNRPKQYNAINEELANLLVESLHKAQSDEVVSSVVLTGRGRAFCAGVDLKALAAGGGLLAPENMGSDDSLIAAFSRCNKPIIGAINGFAVTGGLEIALACDFLYAGESASFADTHAIVGLVPGWGLSQKLPRLIGLSRAQEMSFTGIYIGAGKALEWGLVNKVCKDEDLMDEVLQTARLINDGVPLALHKIK